MTVQRNLRRWSNGDAAREAVRRTIEDQDRRITQLSQALVIGKTAMGNGAGMGLTEFQRAQVLDLVAGRSSAVIGQEVVDPLVVGLPTNNGTVTSFSAGDLNPLFTTNETTPTTTPTLNFAQIVQNANLVYAGPASGVGAAPTFRVLASEDLPPLNVITITTVDSPYAATDADDVILVDASGGAVSVDMQAAATALEKAYRIKKIDASANAMKINSADLIDGAAFQGSTVQYEAFVVVPDNIGATFWLF